MSIHQFATNFQQRTRIIDSEGQLSLKTGHIYQTRMSKKLMGLSLKHCQVYSARNVSFYMVFVLIMLCSKSKYNSSCVHPQIINSKSFRELKADNNKHLLSRLGHLSFMLGDPSSIFC